MNNNNNQTEHAYQLIRSWLSRLVLLYFPVVGISFLVFSLLTFLPFLRTSIEDSLLTTCVGLIVFICTIYMYRVLTQARIVVTEDGITYYGWGYCMYTPWKNIIGLTGFRPYQFTILHTRTISGFQLSQNYRSDLELAEGRLQGIAVLKTTWWNPTWSMAPFANKFPLVEAIVGKNWQEGEFGRDVQQYIPWIFHHSILQENS